MDVTRNGNRRHKAGHASVGRRIPTDRLDAMIEEAIVDAYTESEQAVGFHATVEQHLQLPFETVVLGVGVTVKKIDVTSADELVAICYRGRERQAIPILQLSLPDPPPAGWEWVEAYRRWARGRW
jgi:Calcium binding